MTPLRTIVSPTRCFGGLDAADPAPGLWDVLREGQIPLLTRADVLDEAAQRLASHRPMTDAEREELDAVPFRREGQADQYVKDNKGNEHAPKGAPGGIGGRFVDKGGNSSDEKQPKAILNRSNTRVKARLSKSRFTHHLIDTLLGGNIENAASLVGALDDAHVEVQDAVGKGQSNYLRIKIKHPLYESKRKIGIDENGDVFIENEEFWMKKSAQRHGHGTRIFAMQVSAAMAAGVAYIKCHAAKYNPKSPGKSHNGYYTWIRLGFDMSLDDKTGIRKGDADAYRRARKAFPRAKTVLDIVATENGRRWWSANGFDILKARFDCSKNSKSMKTLRKYLAKEGLLDLLGDDHGKQ